MFHVWESFYLILGPSAGALIGLLFVVATLTAGLERSSAMRGASIFMTPTVFHFGVVLVMSAVAAVPGLGPQAAGAIVLAAALAGFVYSLRVIVMIRKGMAPGETHWSDLHCYGCAPAAVYAVLAAAGIGVGLQALGAAYLMAVALLALLLLSIRNSWDLCSWLAGAARTAKP